MLSSAGALVLTLALQAAPPPAPAPPPSEPDQPITRFFQNLGTDLVRVPSRDSALIAAVGAGAALALRPADDNLGQWAADLEKPGYTSIGRTVGDGWVQGGAALAVYGAGLLSRDDTTTHLGSDLIRTQALNAVMTRVFKLAARRDRPGGSDDSMPSGHSSASFATATVLAEHLGWEIGVPAYAAAGFVGWTRVRDRAHWLTDVVVGAAVGTIAGRTVTAGHRARSWTIVPVASGTAVAVFVTKIR